MSTVDASQAGEGNLEITISARGQNIPTQVTPQGNARFSVSFVPFEASEHVINIAFNKKTVPGCPIVTRVGGDSHVTVSGQALSSAGLGRQSYLTVSNVAGSLEDLEVNVEGKYRCAWFARVHRKVTLIVGTYVVTKMHRSIHVFIHLVFNTGGISRFVLNQSRECRRNCTELCSSVSH